MSIIIVCFVYHDTCSDYSSETTHSKIAPLEAKISTFGKLLGTLISFNCHWCCQSGRTVNLTNTWMQQDKLLDNPTEFKGLIGFNAVDLIFSWQKLIQRTKTHDLMFRVHLCHLVFWVDDAHSLVGTLKSLNQHDIVTKTNVSTYPTFTVLLLLFKRPV